MTEDERSNTITGSMDMSLSKLQEMLKDREAWRAAVHGNTKSRTGLNNNKTTATTLNVFCLLRHFHIIKFFSLVFKN